MHTVRKTPSISVITVCRNEVALIEKTVTSVLNQSYSDMEFVVVDGASTDGTVAILRQYGSQITKLITEPDQGIYSAMNKGLQNSTMEYVYFLNGGDSFYNSEVLEIVMNRSAGEDIIYGDMVFSWGNGTRELRRQPERMTYLRFIATSLWQPACLVRRDLFEKVGYFDETLEICSDYEFFMKAIFREKVSSKYIPIPFSMFDTRGISRREDKREIHSRERKEIQKKYFPFLIYVLARTKPYLLSKSKSPAAAAALGFLTRLNSWLRAGHY